MCMCFCHTSLSITWPLLFQFASCAYVDLDDTAHIAHLNQFSKLLTNWLMSILGNTHAHHVPHAEHVENSKWWSSKRCRDAAVLSSAYPVHGSASKVNRSGADAQVVSCHRYLVVFHPFIEQLTVFHISGLVLASSSILESLTSTAMASWAARAKEVRKLCVNPYISIVNP